MSGMTATHETYTKPPAVAAKSGCSRPAYFVANNPIAVPANAANAVANCAPIACHFLKPHNKKEQETKKKKKNESSEPYKKNQNGRVLNKQKIEEQKHHSCPSMKDKRGRHSNVRSSSSY